MAEEKKEEYKDYFLSINGKCMLPKQLINGHNYKIETDIILTDQNEKIDKKTGDKYLYYKGELDGVATIKNDKGHAMYSKERRSQSQLLRHQIRETCQTDADLDDHYAERMTKLRHFWPEVDEYLDKLIDQEAKGEIR